MNKLKTHSGAKKRFKTTASGKVKRKRTRTRHLKVGKINSRRRRYNQPWYIEGGNEARMRDLIPYL